MTPFVLPAYFRVRAVHSFEELCTTRFADGVNALCWQRALPGDFREVAEQLRGGEGITTLDEAMLRTLRLSDAGRVAVGVMLEDHARLVERGLDPVLDCINGYLRDESPAPVRTDVLSFHADSATAEADTWLCTYYGPSSEGLPNEQAQRWVDVPETRAQLLGLFGGADDAEFQQFLSDHGYDLHYRMLPGAEPYSFGVGNLWRISTEYPGAPVPPCIHRAPEAPPGQLRLLLIS